MRKKVISILGILLLIGIITSAIIYLQPKKFKLDEKYYNEGKFLDVSGSELANMVENKESFILFEYNYFCAFRVPCEDIFKEAFKDLKIDVNQISYDEFKETKLHEKVKYAPSIILVKKGRVVKYLDASKDEDKVRYQDTLEFKNWIKEYIEVGA